MDRILPLGRVATGPQDRLKTGSNRPLRGRCVGFTAPPGPPVQFGQHLRGQQVSFQPMRLMPVFSTAYPVQVAGLWATLDSSDVNIIIHGSTPVRRRAWSDTTPHLASDELHRAHSPRGAVVRSAHRQRNSLSYLEFKRLETRIDPYMHGIIVWMKKTLHIDEQLLRDAKSASGARTDTDTVRLGLEALVRHGAIRASSGASRIGTARTRRPAAT